MNIKWNASKYTEDFSFVHKYGNSVTELLETPPSGRILDLGCGNGTLSKTLSDKGFSVIGMDASADMIAVAKESYPEIEFINADAADFALDAPVDAVFSNAVFHWIDKEKQPQMLDCVYRALKNGGEFVFEFGGKGNTELIHEALADNFAKNGYLYKMPFFFPSVGEYSALLENAGFQVVFASLFERPTELKGENGLAEWIRMFVKTPFENIEDKEIRKAIIAGAEDNLRDVLYKDGKWYADYVRIRMKAIKKQ